MGFPNSDLSDLIVSPEWLYENKDKNLVIVDCPWEYYSYTRAHIPGALCRPGHPYIKALDEAGGQSVLIASGGDVQSLLGGLGIGADSTVVVYDDWGSIFSTRFWWVCKYYGFEGVKVLDGGWQGWVSSGYPVSFESSKPAEVVNPLELKVKADIIISSDELLQNYSDPGLTVLDVRSDDEYNGRAAHGNKRTGHVPGALHLEWSKLLQNSEAPEGVRKFKSAGEIEKIFEDAGVQADKTVVTHCQAAVRATFTAFALELVGYDSVRVYDGSMAEWANRDDTPLE